jgi:predicted RNA-binding protein with PUA-like domain
VGYWLLKSEPETFSIDDLAARGREPWTGVRNYQARNYLRDAMRLGDGVLFYHSSCARPGVVGIAEVVSPAYPDPTQFDPQSADFDPRSRPEAPRWWLVEIAFRRKLRRTIPLTELKQRRELDGLPLLRRGNRLSVIPLRRAHWDHILRLE